MEFENKMKQIDEAIAKLESGELGLDEAIEVYSSAMKECNACSKYLTKAKGKVEVLEKENEEDANSEK